MSSGMLSEPVWAQDGGQKETKGWLKGGHLGSDCHRKSIQKKYMCSLQDLVSFVICFLWIRDRMFKAFRQRHLLNILQNTSENHSKLYPGRHTAATFGWGFGTWVWKSKPILFSDPAFREGIIKHILKIWKTNISEKHTKQLRKSWKIGPGGSKIMNNEVWEVTWRRLVPKVAPGTRMLDEIVSEWLHLGSILGSIFGKNSFRSASFSTSNRGRHF
jgi:hypothetical protein